MGAPRKWLLDSSSERLKLYLLINEKRKKMDVLQGEYYFFERDTELVTADQMNDRDAIRKAETEQTALIKFTFDDGHLIKRRTLYAPERALPFF